MGNYTSLDIFYMGGFVNNMKDMTGVFLSNIFLGGLSGVFALDYFGIPHTGKCMGIWWRVCTNDICMYKADLIIGGICVILFLFTAYKLIRINRRFIFGIFFATPLIFIFLQILVCLTTCL